MWIDDALEQLATMEHTCSLDVADAHPTGIFPAALASLLGITTQRAHVEVEALIVREDVREALRAHHGAREVMRG